jgi:hypothetical protein
MVDENKRLGQLTGRREELKRELAAVGELRPGALVGRYRKCGKASCHCADAKSEGHGPSWSLTRMVGGKTLTKIIPAAAVEKTREQIAEHRRFRDLAREFVEVSEKVCDAQLASAAEPTAAKKGGSKKPSRTRSSRSSKRS